MGKNPVNGGNPPRDKNKIGNKINWFLNFIVLAFIWASVFLFNLNNVRKIGVIKIEYIKKYIIVGRGMFIYIRANIQPMWVIDE